MNFLVRQKIKRRLEEEKGACYRPGQAIQAAMVYPNQYFFGMSNLGFQTLYRIFNQVDGVSCERLFFPEEDVLPHVGEGNLRTYENEKAYRDLDLLAFSISYQNDYLNILPMMRLMGLPHRQELRGEGFPLVIAGGPAVTINPEPIAPMFDALVIGEGEEVAAKIVEVLKGAVTRKDQLEGLSRLDGVYVPSLFENPYHEGLQGEKSTHGFGIISGKPNGPPQSQNFIRRLVVRDPEVGLAESVILTPDTEFGDLYLLEVQRGCQWGCRFCAAGFMYRYPRYDTLDHLKSRIDEGLKYRNKVGLIAGDLLGHENIHEILAYIDSKGGGFSPSSVRLNAFTPEIIHFLKKSGNRTIAIAPEAGSERLRRALNKTFTQEEVVEAAVKLAEGGIHNIKLYIMIGLPGETEEDMEELCRLTLATRGALSGFAKRSGKMPTLTLSVSPFVPKPSTPLQYAPFAGISDLKDKLNHLRKRLMPQGHIKLSGESSLDAYLETLLSRGDRRVMEFLEKAVVPLGKSVTIGNPGHLRKVLRSLSFDPGDFVTRSMDPEESCPWDFIDHGIKKSFFQRELEKFTPGKVTHYCMPEVCRSCGVC